MNARQIVVAVMGTVIRLAVAVVVVMFLYKAALVAYDYGYRVFQEPPVAEAPGTDIAVDITMGKSAYQIGEILESKGLIRDAGLFYIQNLLSHYKDELHAGSYTLNTSMTMEEMMEIMSVDPDAEGAEETGNE